MAITIAILRQAGLSAETIARVCELEEQERLAHRRMQVREAVARHRSRKRGNQSNLGNDYTDYTNGTKNAQDLPSLTSSESTSRKKERDVLRTSRARRRATQIENFQPDIAWAVQDRKWTSDKALLEAQKFKDWATAHGRVYIDWTAAWRNWCRSAYQTKGNGNGHGQQPPRQYSQAHANEEWRRALDKLKNYEGSGSELGADDDRGLPLLPPT